jgi:hypothetical protein
VNGYLKKRKIPEVQNIDSIMFNLSLKPMNCSNLMRFSLSLLLVFLLACSKSDSGEDPTTNPQDNDKMQLVTDLNGYKFEGSFREPNDPIIYSDVSCNYVEEYNDGLRVVFSSRDNLENNFRWYPRELRDGKVIQEMKYQQGKDLSPNNYVFAFDNSSFLLYGYEKKTSVIVTFKPDGTKSAYYLSKPNNNFIYHFDENYTIFWGNAASVYVHENKNHSYTPPAPNIGFILTSEPSVAWAAYLVDDDIVNPYSFRDQIYTGFFNATYNGNYIGIAKGAETLDTLVVNKYDPTLYYSGNSGVAISKAGNKIYILLVKIKSKYGTLDYSLYEMDETERVIRPVYLNIEPPFTTGYQFINGQLYGDKQVFKPNQQYENIPFPTFIDGAGGGILYGKKKKFLIVQKNLDLVEIYSKPY